MNSPLDTDEWRALVSAIRFDPASDTERLVAADWLEEQDDAALRAWGQFIRAQIAASMNRNHVFTDSCDCVVCQGERRAVTLFDQWNMFWFSQAIANITPLEVKLPRLADYSRGFLVRVLATYRPWKLKETPRLVRDLFARTPLNVALVELQDDLPAYRGGPFPWTVYVLKFTVERITLGKKPALSARCALRLRSDDATNEVGQTRIVMPGNDLGRYISGAVSATLPLRGELDMRRILRRNEGDVTTGEAIENITEPVLGGEG